MKNVRLATFAAIAVLVLSMVPAATAADAKADPGDFDIVSGARLLSVEEIRNADVTDSEEGQRILQAAADGPDGLDIGRRPYRAFSFGHQKIAIDGSSQMTVSSGLNDAGELVYEVVPHARPNTFSPRAGYVVPPDSAWVYNSDGGYTHFNQFCDFFNNNCADGWKRTVYWTITAAWNQGSYQYFRMYGRMQAQVVTGAPYNPVWARAYLELDNGGGWGGTPTDNFGEFAEPDEDIAGQANVTITAGFKVGITVELGKPPVTVGGGYDQTYTGSLVTSGEWWHPIVRSEVASGGVQYCKYTGAGFLSKKVATRVSLRQAKGASLGFWYLYDVQQTSATACPGPN